GAVAGASQNSWKHVRLPIDHVGVAVAALGDQSDILRNGRMRGTGPLAIDHFVEIVGGRDISRFHSYLVHAREKSARPFYSVERLAGLEPDQYSTRSGSDDALVVSRWGHWLILLEPFKITHKANF